MKTISIKYLALFLTLSALFALTLLTPTVQAKKGSGILIVCIYGYRGLDVEYDAQGRALVEVGQAYYISLYNILEAHEGDALKVRICYTKNDGTGGAATFIDVMVVYNAESDRLIADVCEWTVPSDAKVNTDITVQYQVPNVKPPYIAAGKNSFPYPTPGHMFIAT
ncbi:MAG TPA: hypothetical protein VJ529_04435 [Candidatus Bathyarchaeia archaeon]|nr:hypothetical protein [Candidatus Bathyarchaeia archaeon]